MNNHPELKAPWSLHFDRDGTEDIAIICDAEMTDIATSGHFWLPEKDDPTPRLLTAFRLMTAAPELIDALNDLLEQTVDQDLKYGIGLSEGEEYARAKALAANGPAIESDSTSPLEDSAAYPSTKLKMTFPERIAIERQQKESEPSVS